MSHYTLSLGSSGPLERRGQIGPPLEGLGPEEGENFEVPVFGLQRLTKVAVQPSPKASRGSLRLRLFAVDGEENEKALSAFKPRSNPCSDMVSHQFS